MCDQVRPRGLLDKPTPEVSTVEAIWRGTQVVRERSAKPLYVGSIPTRASNLSPAPMRNRVRCTCEPGSGAPPTISSVLPRRVTLNF